MSEKREWIIPVDEEWVSGSQKQKVMVHVVEAKALEDAIKRAEFYKTAMDGFQTELEDAQKEIAALKEHLNIKERWYEDLQARAEKLVEALKSLKNEATGFVNMADPDTHGHTNISVMRHWINNAGEILAEWEARG